MYLKKRNRNNSIINISSFPVSDSQAVKNALTELNGVISEYGLFLSVKQVNELAFAVQKALRESNRIEIGSGIMPVIAEEFSNSVFINQENYVSVLKEIISLFFKVKTAVCDSISDKNLVRLIKDYYENKAFGSVELMSEKDIDILIKFIETENGTLDARVADVYDSEGYTDERS